MGGALLAKLAYNGQLIDFLEEKEYKGKKLIDYLGGWMKAALPLRNKKIAAYHTNWIYFESLFGVDVIGYVEPKPGIPPSPKHIEELVQEMRTNEVKVLLAANYFDENKVRIICDKVGAEPVIVPMFVNGAPGTENVFKLIDVWISKLNEALVKVKQ
jgi:ABC-type Zn uptake system ZnuABC Zn-binding protein ZnuA